MRKPAINKVVGVLFFIAGFLWVIATGWSIKDAYFPAEGILTKHPNPNDAFYLFNKIMIAVGLSLSMLHLWLARELRNTNGSSGLWRIITIMHVVYAIMVLSPVALVILIFWCRNPNREYHCCARQRDSATRLRAQRSAKRPPVRST